MGGTTKEQLAILTEWTNRPLFLRSTVAVTASTTTGAADKQQQQQQLLVYKNINGSSHGDETETTVLLDNDDDEQGDNNDHHDEVDDDDSSYYLPHQQQQQCHDHISIGGFDIDDDDGSKNEAIRTQQQQQPAGGHCSGIVTTCSNATAAIAAVAPPPTPTTTTTEGVLVSNPRRLVQLLFGTIGIYGAYLSYGMYQEDLYRYRGPEDNHDTTTTPTTLPVFRFVWFLQVLESAASIGLGYVGRKFWTNNHHQHHHYRGNQHHHHHHHKSHKSSSSFHNTCQSLRPFLWSGAAQVLAKVFMSMSLVMGASFPVATLAKSAKIVPVMIGQLVLGGAHYHRRDGVFAVLVVSGTVLLSLGKTSSSSSSTTTLTNHHHNDASSSSSSTEPSSDTVAGVVFILLSLVMDGCVGGLQQQMKRQWKDHPPTTYDYVLFSHISMIGIAGGASLLTGDWWSGIRCLVAYPAVARMVAAVCCLSVLGQWFIFYVISHFDPLVCATITTTRKIWSVLLSIALKGYTLSSTGYAGLALAILGLALEVEQKARPTVVVNGGGKLPLPPPQLSPRTTTATIGSSGIGSSTTRYCCRCYYPPTMMMTMTMKQKKKRRAPDNIV